MFLYSLWIAYSSLTVSNLLNSFVICHYKEYMLKNGYTENVFLAKKSNRLLQKNSESEIFRNKTGMTEPRFSCRN